MSNDFNFEQEIKNRGYLNFKVIANKPFFYKINDDDTLIKIEIAVDNILDDSLYPNGILLGGQTIVYFTTPESRKLDAITQNQDLESTLMYPGKFVFEMDNRISVEFQPSITQIVRTGRKLAGGSPEYLTTLQNKQLINKL